MTSPFRTFLKDNKIILEQVAPIAFTKRKRYKAYTYSKAGFSITKSLTRKEKRISGNEEEIIRKIHTKRFSEHEPYVITGGHFYPLYVRNLGIFYNALLDPRIPSSEKDWINRQSITLRTVALDLEIFRLAGRSFTTIMPVRNHMYTGKNIYTKPSDSLFGICYTLLALSEEGFISSLFPTERKTPIHTLQTQDAAKKLLQRYKESLTKQLEIYAESAIDEKTGLIRKDMTLSSARDGIKRESSFYDNVILWATLRYAEKLGIDILKRFSFAAWKKRIIDTFWDEEEGMFLDDFSEETQAKKLFSADSLIITSSGFLSPSNTKDTVYLHRIISAIKKRALDVPFPIHYSTEDSPKRLYRTVRHFAPSYMGTSIWSHWGMEYIKLLLLLTNNKNNYLNEAKKHISSYKENIEEYGGYPETYDTKGKLLQTRLYRSVLHNGWVINYEQAKVLLTENMPQRLPSGKD